MGPFDQKFGAMSNPSERTKVLNLLQGGGDVSFTTEREAKVVTAPANYVNNILWNSYISSTTPWDPDVYWTEESAPNALCESGFSPVFALGVSKCVKYQPAIRILQSEQYHPTAKAVTIPLSQTAPINPELFINKPAGFPNSGVSYTWKSTGGAVVPQITTTSLTAQNAVVIVRYADNSEDEVAVTVSFRDDIQPSLAVEDWYFFAGHAVPSNLRLSATDNIGVTAYTKV